METCAIRFLLRAGFAVNGAHFQPLVFFTEVEDPDFGCEGCPDGSVWQGRVRGLTAEGPAVWQLDADALWHCGFDTDMWLGCLGTSRQLLLLRAGRTDPHPAPAGAWLEPFR